MKFIVAAFYHFFDFPEYAEKRKGLQDLLIKNNIKGSLLIAAEGLNGTLSGTRENIDAVLSYLEKEIVRGPFEHKESLHDAQPFGKAKVRLKKELISLGEPISPRQAPRERGSQAAYRPPLKAGDTGTYVEAKDWNKLISDPNVILLDARNAYETHLGMFENAVDPKTKNFKELPAFVRKNLKNKKQEIATYCTGGIRCEKLTAWMKQEGFENVYHLKGGILKYLEEIPAEENIFRGECYVFDERIAVGHGLLPSSTASMCQACGHALTESDRAHALYSEGVSCPHCEHGYAQKEA